MATIDQYTPTAICNRALDLAGLKFTLGDIEEGTEPARICLRVYGESLNQLLRAAPWNFARKAAPLFLLADATGQTANVGAYISSPGWTYAYAYPQDMAKLRYIPWSPFFSPGVPTGNLTPPNSSLPITTASSQTSYIGQRVVPSRFLVTSDLNNLPSDVGQNPNVNPGVSPIGRTVILSNVPSATCVYTFTATYPNLFDYQFRGALEALIAAEVALVLYDDKRMGMAIQDRLYGALKTKVAAARAASADEGWSSSDIGVDWIQGRAAGGSGGGYGWAAFNGSSGEYGCWGAGWAGTLSLGNGSAF